MSLQSKIKENPVKLLFLGDNDITMQLWERIICSLITMGDCVLLQEGVDFSKSIQESTRNYLESVFEQLKEERLIRIWNHEKFSKDVNTIVIPTERSIELYDMVNEHIYDYNAVPSITSGTVPKGIEITSKVIEFRHEMWNMGIAHLLESSSICYPGKILRGKPNSELYKYEKITEQYIQTIFKKLELPSVAYLNIDDILYLRKNSSSFKMKIIELTSEKQIDLPPADKTIIADCENFIKKHNDYLKNFLQEKSLSTLGKDLTKDSVMVAAGILVPSFSLIPLAEKMVKWLVNNRKYSFACYIMSLNNRAMKSQQDLLQKNLSYVHSLSI